MHTVPRREVGLDARDRPLFSGGDRWIDAACRALAEAGCLVPRSTRSCRAVRLNQSPRPFRTSPYLVSPLDTTALAAVFRLLLGKARRCGVQAGQGMPGRPTGPFRPRHGGAPPPAPGPHFCPRQKGKTTKGNGYQSIGATARLEYCVTMLCSKRHAEFPAVLPAWHAPQQTLARLLVHT